MRRFTLPWKWLALPPLRFGRKFARDQRGVTMIEFAFLALPFFFLIYATLETTFIFFAGQILDSAANDASRLVRTGQAQAATYNVAAFKNAVCDGLFGIFDCTKLKVKVNTVTNFATATAPYPTKQGSDCNPTCDWIIEESFAGGVGSQVVMVQVYYKWPVLVTLPGLNMQNQPDGVRLLSSIHVFQNEPF